MAQSLPPCLHLSYALNPAIRATYSQDCRVTFTAPEALRGREVKNLFEASMAVRNRPSFPFSDWVVTDDSKAWNAFQYEQAVIQQHIRRKAHPGPAMAIDPAEEDPAPPSSVDPRTLPYPQWTSALVSNWIITQGSPPLVLREITHFRRYGPGLCFEFLCAWDLPAPISTWQKYADLQHHAEYAAYVRAHWNSKVEKERNWEDEFQQQTTREQGFDVVLPEVGRAYAVDKDTLRGERLLAQYGRSKKKPKDAPRRRMEDEEEDLSDGDRSSSSSSSDSDEDRVPQRLQTAATATAETIPWQSIFETSSVSPVPQYKVKRFKAT